MVRNKTLVSQSITQANSYGEEQDFSFTVYHTGLQLRWATRLVSQSTMQAYSYIEQQD